MFKGVSDVFLPVRDLDRAIAWYENTLGFIQTFRDDERRAAGVKTPDGGHLTLVESGTFHPVDFPANDFEVRFGFNLATDADDIETVRAHLAAAGAEVEPAVRSFDGTFACFAFRDPDGNPMSVVRPG